MRKARITIEIEVHLDQVPGWGHEVDDFVTTISADAVYRIPHYTEEVKVLSVVEFDDKEPSMA